MSWTKWRPCMSNAVEYLGNMQLKSLSSPSSPAHRQKKPLSSWVCVIWSTSHFPLSPVELGSCCFGDIRDQWGPFSIPEADSEQGVKLRLQSGLQKAVPWHWSVVKKRAQRGERVGGDKDGRARLLCWRKTCSNSSVCLCCVGVHTMEFSHQSPSTHLHQGLCDRTDYVRVD